MRNFKKTTSKVLLELSPLSVSRASDFWLMDNVTRHDSRQRKHWSPSISTLRRRAIRFSIRPSQTWCLWVDLCHAIFGLEIPQVSERRIHNENNSVSICATSPNNNQAVGGCSNANRKKLAPCFQLNKLGTDTLKRKPHPAAASFSSEYWEKKTYVAKIELARKLRSIQRLQLASSWDSEIQMKKLTEPRSETGVSMTTTGTFCCQHIHQKSSHVAMVGAWVAMNLFTTPFWGISICKHV